jgi:YD repeat-containing protein
MTKYGGINIGLQTGTAQLEIPLYTVKTKDLSMPISLSYAGTGVKVDEIASRTGISWLLNSGGLITRTVNDDPDESATKWSPPNDSIFNRDAALLTWLNTAGNGSNTNNNGVDVAPDFFSFNFNGRSGRFILSGDTVLLLSRQNLKIETTLKSHAAGWSFKVTDADGVMYFFGGIANSAEFTYSWGECANHYTNPVVTAWYLSAIVHPNGDTVNFKYDALTTYSYPVSISQEVTRSANPLQTCGEGSIPYIDDRTCKTSISTSAVRLSKITASNNCMIKFKYAARRDLPYDGLVDSICIYLPDDTVNAAKSFKLGYVYSTGNGSSGYDNDSLLTLRPFLTKVTENGKGTSEQHVFELTYNNIQGLAPRLSFSQDRYGYFNGANNSGMIPQPPDFAWLFPGINANRESNFATTCLGMLTKIKYPTGGYDSLEYTAPLVAVTEQLPPVQQTASVSSTGTGLSGAVTKSDTFHISNYFGSKIGCSFQFMGNPNDLDYHAMAVIKIIDLQTNQVVYTSEVNSDNPTSLDSIGPGSGDFVLRCTSYGQYTLGQGVLNYWVKDPAFVTHNVTTAGIMVNRVRTYDPVANNTSIKKYYYTYLSNPGGLSSGTTMFKPAYLADFTLKTLCYYTPPGEQSGHVLNQCGTDIYYKTLSSNSLVNLYAFSQHHMYFSSVIESFGDGFENGGIEHRFIVWPDFQGEVLMGSDLLDGPLSNNGIALNGRESFTNYFTKRNGAFVPVKQITNNYRQDNRLFGLAYGYTIRRNYNTFCQGGSTPLPSEFEPFDVKRNYIYAEWAYADTVDTKEFDINGINTLTTRVIYNFDNLKSLLPTRVVSFNSKGDSLITRNKYPHDIDKATVSAEAGAAIDSLISKHIISPVLLKEEYKNASFLRRLSTYYKNWPNNISEPRSVEFKLSANPAETRILFDNYDAYGNILEQYKINDRHLSYIWDYHNEYPIAEANNAQTNDIAYTSFEADGTGNWTISGGNRDNTKGFSGNSSHKLTAGATISKAGLTTSKSYRVTYWSQGGALAVGSTAAVAGPVKKGWTYYEHSIPAGASSVSITGAGVTVDEIRLYPTDALMTTYTYSPFIGITSETSPNSITTYYEYDGFMRLARIRDSDGNITKTFDYHYQGQ